MAAFARGVSSLSRKLSLDCPDARSSCLDLSPVTPSEVSPGKASDGADSTTSEQWPQPLDLEPALPGSLTHAHSLPAQSTFFRSPARRMASVNQRVSMDVDAPPCARFPYSQPPMPCAAQTAPLDRATRPSSDSMASDTLQEGRSAPMPIRATRSMAHTDSSVTDRSPGPESSAATSVAHTPGRRLSAAEAERAKSYREWHDVFYASSY